MVSSGEEGRPPDPAASNAERRKSRRVKWLDDRQRGSSRSSHALDELGRDPEAFETLRQALERYRSSSSTHKHSTNTQPAKAAPSDTLLSSNAERADNHPVRRAPGCYIDPDESAGLPGIAHPEEHAYRQAEEIVRRFSIRKNDFVGVGTSRGPGKDVQRERGANGSDPVPDIHNERDVEGQNMPRSAPSSQRPTGVLSSLLSMPRRFGQNSLPASRPDSESSSEDSDRPEIVPNHHRANSRSRPSHFLQRRATEQSTASGIGTPTKDDISPPEPARTRGVLEKSLSNAPFSMMGSPPSRKMRTGGGVFGPLIASTGNIAGIAAPIHSQLQPNLKRPGYHLTRYSMEQAPTLGGLHSRNPSFAHSIASSIPGTGASTPNSFYSPPKPSAYSPRSRLPGSSLLKEFQRFGLNSGRSTPTELDESDEKRWQEYNRRKDKRPKRTKKEIYITRHVAELLQREEFILKFARAMMMFGGPSHRLMSQLQSTARVLDMELSCLYLPDVLLISFDDPASGTSHLKFIRQSSSLDLGKLTDAYAVYWRVIHDEISVSAASTELDAIMCRPQFYKWWQLVLIGGMCSSAICSVSFNGSFIDTLAVFPMGALLVGIQILSVRNELYSNVFELTVATLFSFISSALASTHKFCYSAVASSSVVLILPGFIVLCGALEVTSRNMTAGSVRLCFAVMYALFLGFGLAMGAEAYQKITGNQVVGSEDYACASSHVVDGPWYLRTPSKWWAFLTVPVFSTFLSAKNQTPWNRKEMPLLVIIACVGWTTNYFTAFKFGDQRDIVAAVGAFAVGLVANLYARFFNGNSFVVMITGILFQLPSGLGEGGLLGFVSEKTAGSSTSISYVSGFQTALQLISVAIGLTVGLSLSLVLTHPIPSKKRAGGVFSM
ncbi:hypothetical protein AX16_009865 [Volvariella volvacea WC 439]|nr:hypothetical protein AX16_009865 [Volvariella volvacea WC 439]